MTRRTGPTSERDLPLRDAVLAAVSWTVELSVTFREGDFTARLGVESGVLFFAKATDTDLDTTLAQLAAQTLAPPRHLHPDSRRLHGMPSTTAHWHHAHLGLLAFMHNRRWANLTFLPARPMRDRPAEWILRSDEMTSAPAATLRDALNDRRAAARPRRL